MACFHCVFAGSCAASASACSTMRGALGERVGDRGLGLGLLLLGELLRRARERLEAACERLEVADGVARSRSIHAARRPPWRCPCAGAPRFTRCSSRVDLAGEFGVLALEVGERLFGRARRGTDRPPARRRSFARRRCPSRRRGPTVADLIRSRPHPVVGRMPREAAVWHQAYCTVGERRGRLLERERRDRRRHARRSVGCAAGRPRVGRPRRAARRGRS